MEACLGKSFDVIIRHQLDPVWNQLVWNRDVSESANLTHTSTSRAPRQDNWCLTSRHSEPSSSMFLPAHQAM